MKEPLEHEADKLCFLRIDYQLAGVDIVAEDGRPTPSLDLSSRSLLLYSHPKIGKSSMAAQFPDALFLECEPGLKNLDVYKVPTPTWSEFLDALKLVAAGGHPFKTIVVDTADNAFKFCSEFVCQKHGVSYEGDLDHGKGWAFVKNEWHRVLTKLAGLPYGLVLISHAQDKSIKTRTGEYTKTVPTLPDRARGVVLGLVDMILYCDIVATKDGEGNTVTQRVVHTKPHLNYEAGDRTGRLPETMPLEFEALNRAFVNNPDSKGKELSND